MDVKIVVIIAVLAVIIIACSIYLILSKKDDNSIVSSDSIYELFDPNNIASIEFIRNKLVVSFNDASLFDVRKLKELGGKGISVIGDKIKFFVSEKVQENEMLYQNLVKRIER